ncbi:CopG family transcriptional regulator [Novosphingobium sp. JCM 18896]|uniref:CopG family transcriptional regulator n=1 Tax=Novosphingobium sp. JCM 18896 TaxID=2989731 RepID=UPI0022228E85|nr:CopG family transcriptional regulator [Novosphingobium sp. JCM 18896]MCW1429343.1 CopG family transcriptional regulator [Novosphingobium sp. JCM 18896]
MKEERVRYQLFLPKGLAYRFEALAAKPGVSKSSILADALAAWIEGQARSDIEKRFGHRLDRLTLALGRVERDGQVTQETLALFIRYQLMVQAPLPEADHAGRAVGRERFATFVRRVGEAIAGGRRTLR